MCIIIIIIIIIIAKIIAILCQYYTWQKCTIFVKSTLIDISTILLLAAGVLTVFFKILTPLSSTSDFLMNKSIIV